MLDVDERNQLIQEWNILRQYFLDDRVPPIIGGPLLIKALHPIAGVTDYTCGYRAYRVGLLQQAISTFGERLLTNLGFVCMVELLLKRNQCDARMVEIPLRLRYDLKPTASKMEAGKHIRQLLHALIAWRMQGFGRDRAGGEQAD
jgi:hypothetical protein